MKKTWAERWDELTRDIKCAKNAEMELLRILSHRSPREAQMTPKPYNLTLNINMTDEEIRSAVKDHPDPFIEENAVQIVETYRKMISGMQKK